MVGKSKIFIIFMPDWLIIVVLSLFFIIYSEVKNRNPRLVY